MRSVKSGRVPGEQLDLSVVDHSSVMTNRQQDTASDPATTAKSILLEEDGLCRTETAKGYRKADDSPIGDPDHAPGAHHDTGFDPKNFKLAPEGEEEGPGFNKPLDRHDSRIEARGGGEGAQPRIAKREAVSVETERLPGERADQRRLLSWQAQAERGTGVGNRHPLPDSLSGNGRNRNPVSGMHLRDQAGYRAVEGITVVGGDGYRVARKMDFDDRRVMGRHRSSSSHRSPS